MKGDVIEGFEAQMQYDLLEDLFHRNPIQSWDDVTTFFGDKFYNLDGKAIRRGEAFDHTSPLPIILDNKKSVLGDLIPSSSWGSSLKNLLTQTSWDKLRHPIIESHHKICEMCGQWHNSLDVHEVWHYYEPTQESIDASNKATEEQGEAIWPIGLQKLVGLIAICKRCHLCFHPGYARVQDKYEETIDRLMEINRWSRLHADQYINELEYRFEKRSEYLWVLDLGFCASHPDGGLTIKGEWKQQTAGIPIFESESKDGDGRFTGVLNAPWRFAREKEFVGSITPKQLSEMTA